MRVDVYVFALGVWLLAAVDDDLFGWRSTVAFLINLTAVVTLWVVFAVRSRKAER